MNIIIKTYNIKSHNIRCGKPTKHWNSTEIIWNLFDGIKQEFLENKITSTLHIQAGNPVSLWETFQSHWHSK